MPNPFRPDFDATTVRHEAKRNKGGAQARRLLALAAIYEGANQTEAATIGSVTVQIVRNRVLRFNEHGPASLIDRKPLGQPSRLTHLHQAALVQAIDASKTSPRAWRRSRAGSAPTQKTLRSGSATRPGSARRTRSPGAGLGEAHAPRRRTTSARHPPKSSVRSAPETAKLRALSNSIATSPQWSCSCSS